MMKLVRHDGLKIRCLAHEGSSPSTPTIYGPYTRADGRKHVIINGKTISYPKYLMQMHLNRELDYNETVDHINGDFTNDTLDNLQILSRSANIKKSAKPAATFTFVCECGAESTKQLRHVKANLKRGSKGPFCSRSCAGTYGSLFL